MTQREADLFRWFEVFSLEPVADEANPLFLLAADRGYVERRFGEWSLSESGWEWFASRAEKVTANCGAGFHEPQALEPRCMWCGRDTLPEPELWEALRGEVEDRVPGVPEVA